MARCETCSGAGTITVSSTCPKCSGTGEIISYDSDGSESMELCSNCEDGLVYAEKTCSQCKGTGEV